MTGWSLSAQDGAPDIKLSGIIEGNQYFLLSRSNATVNGITADVVYPYKNNALSDEGEHLRLFDAHGRIVDEIDASAKWPAGDKATKQTMERTASRWQTSHDAGGTPKAPNSTGAAPLQEFQSQQEPQTQSQPNLPPDDEQTIEPPLSHEIPQQKKESAPPSAPEKKQETAPLLQTRYPTGILFNELLPSPDGPDEQEEWVEIINNNIFSVDLGGWQIENTSGNTKTYTFPEGTAIAPKGFLVLPRKLTKIVLHNEGDGLIMKNPIGIIADQVSYRNAPTGQSYNRVEDDWLWSTTHTPGEENTISQKDNREKARGGSNATKLKKTLKDPQEGLAAAGKYSLPEQKQRRGGRFYPFIIAGITALFAGLIVVAFSKRNRPPQN